MKKLFVALSVISLAVATSGFAQPTQASALDAKAKVNCHVETLGSENSANHPNSIFSIKDNQATVYFRVVGGDDCDRTVALKSWLSPSESGRPNASQKLFQQTQRTFKPGQHHLTVDLPARGCFYQVDFVHILDDREAGEHNRMLGYVLDGKKSCLPAATTPTTPQTPATPTTPTATTVAATTAVAPAKLVNTGPGSMAALFAAVTAIAGGAHMFIMRRRAAADVL